MSAARRRWSGDEWRWHDRPTAGPVKTIAVIEPAEVAVPPASARRQPFGFAPWPDEQRPEVEPLTWEGDNA